MVIMSLRIIVGVAFANVGIRTIGTSAQVSAGVLCSTSSSSSSSSSMFYCPLLLLLLAAAVLLCAIFPPIHIQHKQ